MPIIDKFARNADELIRRLGGAPTAKSNISGMLSARRRIVDNVVSDDGSFVTKVRSPELRSRLDEIAPGYEFLKQRGAIDIKAKVAADHLQDGTLGMFLPGFDDDLADGMASYRPGAWQTRRHEIMHGYTNAARLGAEGMPLSSRFVAAMPRALGRPLDELVASRVGGKGFSDIPWGDYASGYLAGGDIGASRVARALEAAQIAADNWPTIAVGGAAGGALLGMRAYGARPRDDGYELPIQHNSEPKDFFPRRPSFSP